MPVKWIRRVNGQKQANNALDFKRSDGKDPKKRKSRKEVIKNFNDKKEHGLPIITPKITKRSAGVLPDTQGKSYLEIEKQRLQVETLMLKGFLNTGTVASILGISHPTAKKLMERVEYSWAAAGSGMKKQMLRGRAKSRLEMLTQEVWQIFSNTKSDVLKLQALSKLMDIHEKQMAVEGLTPNTIVAIMNTSTSDTPQRTEMADSINHMNKMKMLADKLKDMLPKDAGAVEGEYTEVPA